MMLEVVKVSQNFGGLTALSEVSLRVDATEVTGLIGPNGSGKTTLFNVISGLYTPSSGKVVFKGADISNLSPDRIAARGLARTFQTPRIYTRMTVTQNLDAAHYASHPGSHRISPEQRGHLLDLLERVGLADRAYELATDLPLADQRRLELVRTLVGDPGIVLLDEPAGGMTPTETGEITDLIRDVVAPGRACVVIEHKIDMIARLCARVVVLNFGHVISDGAPTEVLEDPVVIEAYLGRQGAH